MNKLEKSLSNNYNKLMTDEVVYDIPVGILVITRQYIYDKLVKIERQIIDPVDITSAEYDNVNELKWRLDINKVICLMFGIEFDDLGLILDYYEKYNKFVKMISKLLENKFNQKSIYEVNDCKINISDFYRYEIELQPIINK